MSDLRLTEDERLPTAAARDMTSSTTPQVMGLAVEFVTSVDGIRALGPEYGHLQLVTGNRLPFALHEWHLAWCEHFLSRDRHIADRPLFVVLRDDSAECVALVPLILTRRRLGPVKVATLGLVGGDPALTEIRTPLIKPGCESSCIRAVHEGLAQVGDWNWIQWSGLSRTAADGMAKQLGAESSEIHDDYVLDLPPTWEELRARLKRNIRESLRHCYNSLKRESHAFEFIVARERAEVRAALARFLELHAMRAEMPWGPKHPNMFAGRAVREFLYEVCDRLALRDVVRVFQLKIGVDIVASRIGFAVADSIYLYYSGFDPAWARYSVMTTTVAEAIKYAIANGFKAIDLSLAAEQSKLRWGPRRVEYHSVLVRRKTLRSRIAFRAYRSVTSGNTAPARILRGLWTHRNWD